jgi:hypothetical protein
MKVEATLNGNVIDLTGSDVIALTKALFDFNNLGVRPSSYSNTFNIPKTQSNRLALGSSGIVNSSSDQPYEKLDFTVKVDGIEVVNGFAELTDSNDKNFTFTAKSGNGSFFNEIRSMTLQILSTELSTLDHAYTATEVNNRRDSSEGIVYPNIDYGWFERATAGDQEFQYFYPALYLKFVLDAAINQLGYKQIGDFWTSSIYSQTAIMAKNVVSIGNIFFVEYGLLAGNDFFVTRGTTQPSTFLIEKTTPLNFVNEIDDSDSLYAVTDIGTAWTVLGYNFPAAFDAGTVFEINLNGTVTLNPILLGEYRSRFLTKADLVVRLEIWNHVTNTFVGYAVQINYTFYNASYVGSGGTAYLTSDNLISSFNINEAINDPSGLAAIAATAQNHSLIWTLAVQTTQTNLKPPPSVTYDSFPKIGVDLEFSIYQDSSLNTPDMNIIDSFDNINLGSAFLYMCNLGGVFPVVDEGLKTIEMVEFDTIKKNKANPTNWSKKLDLSNAPQISYKLDYAKRNLFSYSNDTADTFLNALTNYGQGVIEADNDNLQDEVTKYLAPFSLCAIAPTFNNTRSMAKIFTGDKYVFNGATYDLDPDAKVGTFKTRVVFLSRVTSGLIQIDGETPVTGNYEVNNTPILFDYVLRNKYTLLNDLLFKSKVVKALIRLNPLDFSQYDFSKPVFIEYFNDTFVVNEIEQFKINEVDSTFVTLIRI